ncbi:MAG: transglycosylase SLT domain-containing protein [Persicimonas sp.]
MRFAFLIGALFTFIAPPATAEVLPADQSSTYRQARTLLGEDSLQAHQRAYELATGLEEFEVADDRRVQLVAEAAERTGRVDEAVAALAEFGKGAGRPIDGMYAHVERGELLLLQGKLEEGGELLAALREYASSFEEQSTEARFLRARRWRLEHDLVVARSDEPRPEQAVAAARRLLVKYPAEDAARRDGLVLSVDDLDAAERFERARGLYDGWAYHQAREEFAALVDDDARDNKHAGEARWYLGHLALNKLRDRPEEAEKIFAELAENGPHAEASHFQVARAQMRQERYEDALDTLAAYQKRYPRGRHVESVYYYRGWLPYDRRDNEAAVEGFQKYIDRYGKGVGRSSYIYGFLGWTYMRMGRWQDAIDTYEEMRAFGNMLVWGKALHWQAYAYNQLGERDQALAKLDELRERYPVTYYGVLGEQLRARIEGRDERASQVWWPDGGGTLDDRPEKSVEDFELRGLSSAEQKIWKRVRALVELGELHMARQEVEPIYDSLVRAAPAAERDAWIHALGHFLEDFHPMWEVATGGSIAAMPQLPEPDSLEAAMAYPRAYRGVVDDVTGEFDLPPELMWSLMRQESRFRPAQISYTDAVGALQMIPKTARKVARDLGVTYNPRTFPRPEVGFRYSGFYMRKLLDTFDGLIVPMATAYNSGPSVVARWFRKNPDAGFAWLIEEFAYNEGRNYGRKVAEHMVRYLYLYEDDEARRGEILDRLFPVNRDIELPKNVGY